MKIIAALCIILVLLPATAVFAASEQHVVMEIKGMTCEVCAVAVKKALTGVPGVKSAKVSYGEKKAWLVVDPSVQNNMLTDVLKKAGDYEGNVIERK